MSKGTLGLILWAMIFAIGLKFDSSVERHYVKNDSGEIVVAH